ncbi:MAG: hypothetical protein IAF38_09770 [Bacteroidia bacterium]|nr:hypothetical protein [Bacteroidia bacterium]
MMKETEKISLTKCKSILQKTGKQFTDGEVSEIREFLYMLAELDFKVFLQMRIREAEFKIENQNSEEQLKLAA